MNILWTFLIKCKLMLITMLISGVALLLACVAFVVFEQVTLRRTMALDLAVLTDLFDDNVASGLTFNDPRASVSAHYGVGKSGSVHQFVRETDTAFHAGIVVRPTWKLIDPAANPNFYTIGIEHEGQPQDVWPDEQYHASAALVREIAGRWKMPLDRDHIIMHREIRASKTCPGSADIDRIISEAAATVT